MYVFFINVEFRPMFGWDGWRSDKRCLSLCSETRVQRRSQGWQWVCILLCQAVIYTCIAVFTLHRGTCCRRHVRYLVLAALAPPHLRGQPRAGIDCGCGVTLLVVRDEWYVLRSSCAMYTYKCWHLPALTRVSSIPADALFNLSRGTASAASMGSAAGLAGIVNSFPLMTQRALKTLCGDILEMHARQAILAERHAGDSEKPDALLRLEKVIDDTRLRVVEMCGERGAEVLAVLDQPEVRARVRVAREEEAVTEDEARVARRRQLRMFNRRSNGGNFSSVSHGVNTSSGQNTAWNEKEADTLSYYQRLQKRHGRGRRGSTAVAGGFKQLWAKNKQRQQQKQQQKQQHSPASVLTASDSQGPTHSNNQELQSPGSSPVAASDGGGHGFPSPLPQYPATRQLQSRPNATNSPLQLQVGQPGDAAGVGHDSVDGGSVATAGGAEAGPPEGGYRGADVLRAGIPDDDAMFVDAQEAAYQLESGNLQPLRALVFKLRGRLGTLKHDSAVRVWVWV